MLLSIISTLFLFGSVTLLIIAISYAFKKPVGEPKQEPDALWVLGLEEALASL
ncbi:MAG TPA: hypothetical protein VEP90_18905 [Methylomirabilota bacterium]|nr:hypothetical protein [Methylomirabilota bacterium]